MFPQLKALDYLASRNGLIPAVRVARALMIAKGDPMSASAYAEHRREWFPTPEVAGILSKAITNPVSTNDNLIADWLPIAVKIADALRPLTIYGRLQPLMRRVPFRVRVVYPSDTFQARFVGEDIFSGGPNTTAPVIKFPLSAGDQMVDTVNLNPAKLALIGVFAKDVVHFGGKGVEEFMAGELLRGLVAGLDKQFIDPARLQDSSRNAPGSVTSTGTSFSSSGATVSAIDSDLGLMINALDSAGMTLSTAAWVMSPITATNMAKMRGTGGSPAYPGLGAKGGELLGIPVLTSGACAAEGSPGERFIALVEAGQVSYADDGAGLVEHSGEADLEMRDDPSGGAQSLTSLWQAGAVATRVTRFVNWKARAGCAAVLRNVTF